MPITMNEVQMPDARFGCRGCACAAEASKQGRQGSKQAAEMKNTKKEEEESDLLMSRLSRVAGLVPTLCCFGHGHMSSVQLSSIKSLCLHAFFLTWTFPHHPLSTHLSAACTRQSTTPNYLFKMHAPAAAPPPPPPPLLLLPLLLPPMLQAMTRRVAQKQGLWDKSNQRR